MQVIASHIPGVVVIEPDVYGDSRGFFMESWNARRYQELGLGWTFVQDNISSSRKGTLRGLHLQNPQPQGKLVTVLSGEVFDVAVDLRRGSPSFGQWVGHLLSSDNKKQMYIPEGCAHGFAVTSESALFYYKCTDFYNKQAELSVRWDDPDLGIDWPIENPVLSGKDDDAVLLRDMDSNQLPVFDAAPGSFADAMEALPASRTEDSHG
ncbi:MAG TPA: dTDP-4-dehydrorhamnose 3,5-epimerase [Rhodothermales bacterium]|nr:dTDP-4-dehydrorhamnose 3,5-epimerase [Rhodothermales bacterium]